MKLRQLIAKIREQNEDANGDFWFFLNDAQCEALIKSYVQTHASEFWGVKDN